MIHLRTLLLLAAVVLLTLQAEARTSRYKRSLHRYSDYHTLVVKGQHPEEILARLTANPKGYRIVIWQSLPEVSSPELLRQVMEWVAQGGVLWFQDSRLASAFGMQADPVHKGELRAVKEHKGHYGDIEKLPGAATFATVPDGKRHPVLERINAVQVFLPLVGPDAYSAVRRTPTLTPLLVLEPNAGEKLYDRLVAALMPHGKGTVVFKPLIFDEQLSGERFQGNLLEYCAGFGVPLDPDTLTP